MVNALALRDTQIGTAETFLLLQLFQPCAVWHKRKGRRWQGCKCAKRNKGWVAENVVKAQGGGPAKSGRWSKIIFCTMGLRLLKFGTSFPPKPAVGRVGMGREGKKILNKMGKGRGRRVERRERCDQVRKQGNKTTVPRSREWECGRETEDSLWQRRRERQKRH